jgi:hypothetical protein
VEEYWFAHQAHHQAIIAAAAKQGATLTFYPIYPFSPNNAETALQAHQSMHDQFNQLWHLTGNDLTTVDLTDEKQLAAFVLLNFREHLAAAAASGQPI